MMQTATLSESKRKFLDALLRGDSAVQKRIEPRPRTESARLGLSQEQIWNRSVRTADSPPLYNETVTVYREGPLDVQILERCFAEILRRHEAWRTSFSGGAQIIHAPATTKIQQVDLRDFPVERRPQIATELLSELAQQPFDLEHGPLIRTRVFRMDDESYRFVLVAHQSIIDGVSIYQILPAELAALYDAFSNGNPSPLPDLPLQYADFANWQRNWLSGENLEQQKAFWKKKLSPAPETLAWPSEQHGAGTYRGEIRAFKVPQHLNSALRELTQREGVTLFMTLLAGFTSLLHRYTGQSDILVATLSPAGRKRAETQKLMGYFLNPVALRFDFSHQPTFHDLLMQTRSVIAEAISNDDVPLEHIAKELGISMPDPFVRVAMSLQPRVPDSQWDVTSMDAQNGGSVWNFYLAFIEAKSGLIGRAQFNPDLFSEETVSSTLEDLWQLLEEAATT